MILLVSQPIYRISSVVFLSYYSPRCFQLGQPPPRGACCLQGTHASTVGGDHTERLLYLQQGFLDVVLPLNHTNKNVSSAEKSKDEII